MSVVPGSPAEKAGLAVGDAITSFGAQMIVAPQDLIAAVKAAPQGKTDIVVIRRGESLNLKVDLGEAAVEAGDNAVQPRDGWLRRGDKVPGQAAQPQVDVKASALQLTDELAKELKLTDEQRKKMADVLAKHTQELTQEAALKSEKSARRRGGITLNLSADVSTLVDKHVADAEKELAGTLSPEQIKQWAAYRKTHNRLSVTQSMKAESVVGDDAGGGGEDMGF
jgi:C-terminal processing protease CtpA/Prc